MQAKIGCGMMWIRDSLITRARNKLVTEFLKQDNYTHLFFIDADVTFEPQQFIRVLLYDKPITAAPYPIKNEDPDKEPNMRACTEILPKGSLVVFPSFVWHRVKPVTKGVRYSLVIWNLGYPFR